MNDDPVGPVVLEVTLRKVQLIRIQFMHGYNPRRSRWQSKPVKESYRAVGIQSLLKVEHIGITGPRQVAPGTLPVDQLPRLGSEPVLDRVNRLEIHDVGKLEVVATAILELPLDRHSVTATAVGCNDPNLVTQPALKSPAQSIRVGAIRSGEPAGNDLHFHSLHFIITELPSSLCAGPRDARQDSKSLSRTRSRRNYPGSCSARPGLGRPAVEPRTLPTRAKRSPTLRLAKLGDLGLRAIASLSLARSGG